MKTILFILYALLFISHDLWAAISAIDKLVETTDSSKCIECHDDIAGQWQTSAHSQSFMNLNVLTSIKRELHKSGAIKKDFLKSCLSCHAPQLKHAPDETINLIITLIATSNEENGNDNFKTVRKKFGTFNVDCRVCHMIKGMPEGKTRQKIIYGPGWDEHEHSHMEEFDFDTLKSDYLGSLEFCTSCHRDTASDKLLQVHSLKHQKETMEKSGAAGKTCKDCHMSSGHSFKQIAE